MDNLRKLLEKLKTIGFLERIFGWGAVRSLLIDAYADIQRLLAGEENLQQNLNKSEQVLSAEKTNNKEAVQRFSQEKEIFQDKISKLEEKNAAFFQRGLELKQKSENLETELQQLREENACVLFPLIS